MKTQVRLLGAGTVTHREGVVDPSQWRTTKTFDLLRVLALSVGHAVEHETLTELFWPSADTARAGTSLRAATYQIRRVLGNDSVVRVGHALMLQEAWVDVLAYRELADVVARARRSRQPGQVVEAVRQAERLYADDLDVTTTDCSVLHETRHELRVVRVGLLLDAAEAAGSYGDWRQSLVFAQQAAAIDTSDRSTRALMQAWFAVGETAKPVEEFERLRHHLAEEYGVDPAPQTRALYLDVVSACEEWPPRETTFGRDDEVRQAVTAVAAHLMDPLGQSGLVWLVGAPGSGRKTVAREAARALMLPLADPLSSTAEDPGMHVGGTLELLTDQGTLTSGLAAMLRLRAATWHRTMLVPVSDVQPGALEPDDSVVRVGALERSDFRRLMALVLQGRPTHRLEEELHTESRGLPGLACRIARHRLRSGTLVWTPQGVDVRGPGPWRQKVVPALAMVPLALAGLVGVSAVVESELRVVEVSERERGRERDTALLVAV